ncbi:MAG: response regulator [Candidatus Saccharimonadales bacterium]
MYKIAIIEDEVAIRRMYALKLQFSNFSVIEASDGVEGLAMVEKEQPDLILLDLMMPKMTGDEMLRELRSTDWGENIPVIILTNISKDEAPRTLWHLGISDFIIKANSTPQKILEHVEKVLSSLDT